MLRKIAFPQVVALLVAGFGAVAHAALPFAEDFDAGAANWRFSNVTGLTAVSSGGPDGSGYVSHTFAFSSLSNPTAASALIFRAQDEYNSSGVAYAGNWLAEGVQEITALVRHNAPEALQFNVRTAQPANFPGASYLSAAVPPNQWTEVVFDVTPSSPQNLTYEGTSYPTVFSNVGHLQFGVDIPESLRGGTSEYTFDLDQVRVSNIPEPATCSLAAVALAGAVAVARRRR